MRCIVGRPPIVLSWQRIDFSFVTKHSDLVREAIVEEEGSRVSTLSLTYIIDYMY